MSNNAKVAGILTIISGAFGVFWSVSTLFLILVTRFLFGVPHIYYPFAPHPGLFTLMMIFYSVFTLKFVLVGILGIVGGVFALKKERWGLALAGAIAGAVTFFPCGIAAIIYITMAKPEFSTPKLPTPAEPPAQ